MMRYALLLVFLVACNKPSDDECRKALTNIRDLMGTDNATTDMNGDIRRCKGGSSKKAVKCAGAAKTLDELRACEFMKVPDKKRGSSTGGSTETGSADAVPTGSATGSGDAAGGSGSAMTGSSADGSGSAMTGSSADGSGTR